MNKTIRSSGRAVIYHVYQRCLVESEAGHMLSNIDNVYQRTADMTGKCVNTIRKIVAEGVKNKGCFSTPGKHRKGRPRKNLDDFDLCAIRQKVLFYYTVKKQVPTLRGLLSEVREDLGYNAFTLHSLGFKYKKCKSDRLALMEKPIIAAKRDQYLRTIMANRNLPIELQKPIIYLDESYVHSSYKLKKCWQSIDIGGVQQNISKGKRYIIVHAGSERGFVPNALLIFSGTNKNEDYHSEMNRSNFHKWITEKLIPNISEPSIIVMDNAPYHSVVLNKAPTSATKVADIKLWLLQNNIPFEDFMHKPELLMIAKRHRPEPVYEIDQILGNYGHTVVRLPPYHCDLNPIELIWGIAKHKIASVNVGSIDIKVAAEQAFQQITASDWKNSCQHVKKIEKEYYDKAFHMYEEMERIIINVNDDSSSDESSELEDEYDATPSTSTQDNAFSEIEYIDESILESD